MDSKLFDQQTGAIILRIQQECAAEEKFHHERYLELKA